MDSKLGLKRRMSKVGNNLRKFGMLVDETAKLQVYHFQIIADGESYIAKKGVRAYCEMLGSQHGVSMDTIKGDYHIMKRYKLV